MGASGEARGQNRRLAKILVLVYLGLFLIAVAFVLLRRWGYA